MLRLYGCFCLVSLTVNVSCSAIPWGQIVFQLLNCRIKENCINLLNWKIITELTKLSFGDLFIIILSFPILTTVFVLVQISLTLLLWDLFHHWSLLKPLCLLLEFVIYFTFRVKWIKNLPESNFFQFISVAVSSSSSYSSLIDAIAELVTDIVFKTFLLYKAWKQSKQNVKTSIQPVLNSDSYEEYYYWFLKMSC